LEEKIKLVILLDAPAPLTQNDKEKLGKKITEISGIEANISKNSKRYQEKDEIETGQAIRNYTTPLANDHMLAFNEYFPKRYNSQILVIRPRVKTRKNKILITHPYYEDPTFGWKNYCSGKIIIEKVAGDHYSMLRKPAMQDLLKVLQKYLFFIK
jgi:thioesterase domain-containing protein